MELDWTKMVNIIKGIAHGISYMHHECIPVIVLRDITSNNILLNIMFQTIVVGTYGYITPSELLFSDYMTIHIFFPFLAYYVLRLVMWAFQMIMLVYLIVCYLN